jgi:CIC family chloride channel protein
MVFLACLVGGFSGVVVWSLNEVTHAIHRMLFSLPIDVRVSGLLHLSNVSDAAMPAVGGVLMGITILWLRRFHGHTLIDPIEANALYGGRISLNDTFIVVGQTVVSNGFGASVGLEAAYTQMGSGLASRVARAFNLRRNDVRSLVGCGAAAAIASAFGAPLTGAFYGFELIIGVYSLANVAPVLAASLSATLVAGQLGATPFPIEIGLMPTLTPDQYLPFMLLGLIAGLASVGVMQFVTLVEKSFTALRIQSFLRPAIGGVIVGLFALISPQVLSSGHGAMHVFLTNHFGFWTVLTVFALKLAASAVSLGSGFRGGLFFASLLLGTLLGNMFATGMNLLSPETGTHTTVAAVVGMTSLAVGIVGGPLTMTFLALESTRDLAISGIVLAAAIVSNIVVRATFGYSFSTWRFHLRGETIRGANDIGWIRALTVRNMMRADVRTVDAGMPLSEFRKSFPLGSAQRVVAIDPEKRYAGMVFVPDAYAMSEDRSDKTIGPILRLPDTVLIPPMNAKAAAEIFEQAKAEELAVVDGLKTRKVVGLLTEAHLIRRYSEELEKAHRDLSGEN